MRVLVATDGSPSAGHAVDLVAGIPWPSGTEVHVVESIDTSPALFEGPWPVIAVDQAETFETQLVQIAGDVLDHECRSSSHAAAPCDASCWRGTAHRARESLPICSGLGQSSLNRPFGS